MTRKKLCPRCNVSKLRVEFSGAGYCRSCMSDYRQKSKGYRPEFENTILTDEDMAKEELILSERDMTKINCLSGIFDKDYLRLLRVRF